MPKGMVSFLLLLYPILIFLVLKVTLLQSNFSISKTGIVNTNLRCFRIKWDQVRALWTRSWQSEWQLLFNQIKLCFYCVTFSSSTHLSSDFCAHHSKEAIFTRLTNCQVQMTNFSLYLIDLSANNGETEDDMVGWHYWLNGHEFEQTLGDSEGQGSLQSTRSQRVGPTLATEQQQQKCILVSLYFWPVFQSNFLGSFIAFSDF